jgi:hypothetical protein
VRGGACWSSPRSAFPMYVENTKKTETAGGNDPKALAQSRQRYSLAPLLFAIHAVVTQDASPSPGAAEVAAFSRRTRSATAKQRPRQRSRVAAGRVAGHAGATRAIASSIPQHVFPRQGRRRPTLRLRAAGGGSVATVEPCASAAAKLRPATRARRGYTAASAFLAALSAAIP